MSSAFDDVLKERFQKEQLEIPKSYDEAVEETIRNLEDGRKESLWEWVLKHKVISAAILILALISTSVSTMAAIGAYQRRLQSMPETVVEKYNHDVQSVRVDADTFSRDLTETEESELLRLREEYERSLKFPKKEIIQVESGEQVPANELCFVASESKFYLPDTDLTEEELLEIIDLQEKRDYSVGKKNQINDAEQNSEKEERADLEWSAKEAIHKIYEIEEQGLVMTEMNPLDDGEKELLYSAGDLQFAVYFAGDDTLERIIFSKEDVDAHKDNLEIAHLSWKRISKLVNKRVQHFTGGKITKKSAYSLMNGKKSAKGTISFYCELSDGTGCVAVYSIIQSEIYDIYTESIDAMKKDIDERKNKALNADLSYTLLKNFGDDAILENNFG